MAETARREWDGLFNQPNQPSWNAAWERFADYMPVYKCDLPPITASDLRQLIRQGKKASCRSVRRMVNPQD